MTTVSLSVDPACDWSWRTATWLSSVAAETDLDVTVRPLSLLFLYGDDINPDWVDMLSASHGALRVMEAARANGVSHDEIREFYYRLGSDIHDAGKGVNRDVVMHVIDASALRDHRDAFDDDSWDDSVRQASDGALQSAGPDVGSPILQLEGNARGIYGPVLAEAPVGDRAVRLFEAIEGLIAEESLLEVKRGRQG